MSTSATDDPVRKSLYRGHSFAYSPRQLRIVWCLWTSADAATATHHVAYGRRLPANRQESASSCHLAKSRERQVNALCGRWRSRSRKAGYDPKETSALGTTTAAMKPRADIARLLVFISDTADPARAAGACEDAPSRCRTRTVLGQPEPDFEFDQRVSW